LAKAVFPCSRIKQILEETHDSPTEGHFGVNRTLEKIRDGFIGRPVSKMSKIGRVKFMFPRRVRQKRGSRHCWFI